MMWIRVFFQYNRSGLDLLNTADEDQIADDQRDFYDKLKAALASVSSAPDTEWIKSRRSEIFQVYLINTKESKKRNHTEP